VTTNQSGRGRLSWEQTALKLAFNIAEYRSQDPFVQVGAVIIKNDGSIFLGYNGAPSGIEINWSDRTERRKRVIHAEANVLNYVRPQESKLIAVTHLPCSECMKTIAQKKIEKVIYCNELPNYDNSFSKQLAEEFKISLIQMDLP
jgi:deoxycytidylate deaminase